MSSSDSDTDDELRAELLALRKTLGSAYRAGADATNWQASAEAEKDGSSADEQSSPRAQTGNDPAQPFGLASEAIHATPDDHGQHQSAAPTKLEKKRQAVQAALNANLKLQHQLELVYQEINKHLSDNADTAIALEQHRLQSGNLPADTKNAQGSTIGPSRFWVKGNAVPEANADTIALLPYYQYLPHRFSSQRWTPPACKELQEQVLVCVKNEAFKAATATGQPLTSDAIQGINAITLTSPGLEDTVAQWSDEFWESQVNNVQGRAGKACRIHWHNHCKPSVSHADWTEEEEANLTELAESYDERHWEDIARDLGTSRPAIDCLMHYKVMQQRVTGHGRFTKEEEHRIWEGVVKFGRKWGAVAAHVGGGRHRQQVMHHFENVMSIDTDVPNKLGRWSPDEDALLVQAVAITGSKKLGRWSQVAQLVPGRKALQCRERWCNVLDPDLKIGAAWTAEEKRTLLEAVQQHTREDESVAWAAVAAQLPGRTDKDVKRQRIAMLAKEQGESCNKIRKQGSFGLRPGKKLKAAAVSIRRGPAPAAAAPAKAADARPQQSTAGTGIATAASAGPQEPSASASAAEDRP